MDLLERCPAPFFTEEHNAYRASLRRFVEKEIEPFASEWDEAETFPRELYKKAAEIGLLGAGFPEEYGGMDVDLFYGIIGAEELGRAGTGGVSASLMSHSIGAPPIKNVGSRAQKQKYLPAILSGEMISALAITEPGAMVIILSSTAQKRSLHRVCERMSIQWPCERAGMV